MMKVKHLSIAMSICFALNAKCWPATHVAQGTIRFEGSIVELSCGTGVTNNATLELTTCPALGRTPLIKVDNVGSLRELSNVTAKLIDNVDRGQYYDQRYELVDDAGAPVQSGVFLITTTIP
jgi:type 1 fimbria pilin